MDRIFETQLHKSDHQNMSCITHHPVGLLVTPQSTEGTRAHRLVGQGCTLSQPHLIQAYPIIQYLSKTHTKLLNCHLSRLEHRGSLARLPYLLRTAVPAHHAKTILLQKTATSARSVTLCCCRPRRHVRRSGAKRLYDLIEKEISMHVIMEVRSVGIAETSFNLSLRSRNNRSVVEAEPSARDMDISDEMACKAHGIKTT
jgi:hypothetical protein